MIVKPTWPGRIYRSLVYLWMIPVLVGTVTLLTQTVEAQTTALDLARQGVRAYRLENYKEAENRFREALRRQSNLLLAMTGLGWTLYDTSRYDEALPVFARAHRLYPDDGSSTRGLAYIHYRQGDQDKARTLLGSLDRDRWPELSNIDLALARKKKQEEKNLQEEQARAAARLAAGDSHEATGNAVAAAPKKPVSPAASPSRDAAMLTSKPETPKKGKIFQEGPVLSYHEENISPSPASREEKSSPNKENLSREVNRPDRSSPKEVILSRKESEPVGTDKPLRPSAWQVPIPLASAKTAKPKSQTQSNKQKAASKPSKMEKPAKMTAAVEKKATASTAVKKQPPVIAKKPSPTPTPKSQSAPAPSRKVASSAPAMRPAQASAMSQKPASPPVKPKQAKKLPASPPVAQKRKPAPVAQAKKPVPAPLTARKKQRIEVARASRPAEPKKSTAPRASEDHRLEIPRPAALLKPAAPKPVATALKTSPAPTPKTKTAPSPLRMEKRRTSIAKSVSTPSAKPAPLSTKQSRGSRFASPPAPVGTVNARFVVPRIPLATGPSQDYTIGGKDVIRVVVFEEPDLSSDNIRVSINGYITYPLLGRVKVAGMTTSQVEQRLTYLLKKDYLVNPQVSVYLREYASKVVNVLGAVQNRGAVPLKGPATLLEVLTLAGGVSATDAGSTLTILRHDKKGVRNITINLERFLKGGDLSQNVPLQNGDTVFVPQADQIFVFGEVTNPGPYKLRSEKVSIVEALTMAGGPTRLAATNRSRIVRVENGKERVIQVNVESIIAGNKKGDVYLKGGDIIVIPQTYF